MQRHKPDPSQKEFDYQRAHRRTLVQEMVIEPFEYVNSRGRKVEVKRTSTAKDLLKAVESKCGNNPDNGWYLFIEEIAQLMSVDERTVTRAIAACEGRGLLKVRRSFQKHVRSHYQIEWSEVTQVILDNPETEALVNRSAHLERRSTTPETTETTHDKLTSTHDKLSITQDKLTFTHDKLSSVPTSHTSSSRARGLNQCINHEDQPQKNHDNAADFGHMPTDVAKSTLADGFSGYAGWPFKLEREHFQDCFKVQLLWEFALKKSYGSAKPTDRQNFFALVFCAMQPVVRNPGGYLTGTLRKIAEGVSTWPTDVASEQYAIKATCKVDVAKEHIKSGKFSRDAERLLELYRSCLNRDVKPVGN